MRVQRETGGKETEIQRIAHASLAGLKYAGQAIRLETQEALMLQLDAEGHLQAEFPLPGGTSVFSS